MILCEFQNYVGSCNFIYPVVDLSKGPLVKQAHDDVAIKLEVIELVDLYRYIMRSHNLISY